MNVQVTLTHAYVALKALPLPYDSRSASGKLWPFFHAYVMYGASPCVLDGLISSRAYGQRTQHKCVCLSLLFFFSFFHITVLAESAA